MVSYDSRKLLILLVLTIATHHATTNTTEEILAEKISHKQDMNRESEPKEKYDTTICTLLTTFNKALYEALDALKMDSIEEFRMNVNTMFMVNEQLRPYQRHVEFDFVVKGDITPARFIAFYEKMVTTYRAWLDGGVPKDKPFGKADRAVGRTFVDMDDYMKAERGYEKTARISTYFEDVPGVCRVCKVRVTHPKGEL